MNAKWSDFILRPIFAGFILTLLFIFCLTTGCSLQNKAPDTEVMSIPDREAVEAGSMALYMQGLLYESATNSKPEKAVAAYSNALKLNPDNKSALSSLVNTLFQQKRFEDAYTALSTYLENFPESTELQIYAAQLADHLEKPGEAAFYCQQALINNPTNKVLAQAAIKYHFNDGKDRKAIRTLERFASQFDDPTALRFALETAIALYREDEESHPAQALKCSETALKFTSSNKDISDVLMLQAYCQLETSQTNRAIETFKESFRSNPENYIPLAHLGKIYASSPKMRQSLEKKRDNADSEIPPATLILGHAYNALNRPQDAAAEFENFYYNNMRRGYFADKEFYLILGATYEEYKAYDKIDKLFKDALGAFPYDPEILNFAAYLWSERGINLKQALKYINIVLEQAPDNPAYLDTKGWILHKSGRHYEALQLLLKACAYDNQESEILDHTGDVLYKVGNEILALDFWKKSYINNPRKSVADKLTKHGEPVPKIKR